VDAYVKHRLKKFYIFYKVNAFGDYCEDNLSNYAAMKSFMLNG